MQLKELLAASKSLSNNGQYDEALSVLKDELASDKLNLHIGLQAYQVFNKAKRSADAQLLLDRLLITYPNNFYVNLNAGNALILKGSHQAAIKILQPLESTVTPQQQVFLSLTLAKAYNGLNQKEKAIEALQRPSENNQHLAVQLVINLYQAQRYEEAYLTCKSKIEIFPSFLGLKIWQVRLLMQAGQRDDAISILSAEITKQANASDVAAIRLELANALKNKGALVEAEAQLRTALELQPDNIYPRMTLANTLKEQGRFEEAHKIVEDIDSLKKSSVFDTASIKGALYCHAYDYPKAIESYKQAAADPQNLVARIKLSGLYTISGEENKAYDLLAEAATLASKAGHKWGNIKPLTSHMAAINNQFRSNPGELATIKEVLLLPTSQRISALKQLVQQSAPSLATATYYLKTLRQADILTPTQKLGESAQSTKIPHKIYQYWDSTIIPSDVQKNRKEWEVKNPDAQFIRIKKRVAIDFLAEHFPKSHLAAFLSCDHAAMEADLIRLAYLYKEGGVYVDVDDRCRVSLAETGLLDVDFFAGQEKLSFVGNNFIGCTAKHPILKAALDLVIANLTNYSAENAWFKTGPGMLTRAVAKHMASFDSGCDPKLLLLSEERLRSIITPHTQMQYKQSDRSWFRAAYM